MADKSPNPLKTFFQDTLLLLQWSLFQPSKVVAYTQNLHPDLVHHTGFTRQLWLARHSAEVRRFLSMQFVLWLLSGLLGSTLFILVRAFPPTSPTLLDISFGLVLCLAGSLMLGIAGSMIGDVSLGVTLSVVGGILLGITLGVVFVVAFSVTVFRLAFVITSGIALGVAGSSFDHLRQRTMDLWTINYWGRTVVGVIFASVFIVVLVLALILIIGLIGNTTLTVQSQVALGILTGLIGGLGLSLAFGLEMLIEERRLNPQSLRWVVIDSLLLGTIGGAMGGLTVGIANPVTLIIFWAILTAAGGGMSMRVGNGLSAIWILAGLSWVFTAGLNEPFTLEALLLVIISLLIGFYGYVRLPIFPVEALLSWWTYRQALRNPDQALSRLRRTPIYWDDLIFYPLPMLDQLLLRALRASRLEGLIEVDFISHSFRQDWAANRARLAYAVETLTGCTSPMMIAAAAKELDWLADEVMVTLEQGAREIVPRLLAIAGGVRATLGADNPYSRRLGYREALDGLDTFRRRLPSLGQQASHRWQPVIDRWQQILLNELETVSANAKVSTIENPYQPGTPLQLSRQELFKGRRQLRDVVVNALLERHRPTLVLHGPRRMGKTSFLLQLPALLPGNTLPAFLDLQRPTATQSTAAFLYSIARAISRDARPYRLMVSLPQRTAFDTSPFETFAEWLEDVALPDLQDFNLLLTFDEFEKLGEAVEAGRLEEQVFDELRYLIQHQTRLALLFAGVQTLDELGPAWSSYFINVKPLTIGYLRPAEAEELIRQPDMGANFELAYTDDVVSQIMTQTHCHPYLLQLVCSAVVEESNARATLYVDTPLLDAALSRALDQGEPYFRNIWHEMGGADGQPFLHQIAKANAPLSLAPNLALERLIRRRILTQSEAGYSVEVPLVRRWLVERAP